MATVNFIPCTKQCVSSMKNEIEYILQDFKVCIEPEKLDCDHTINFQTYNQEADRAGNIRLISGKDCCPETAFGEFMATKSSYKKLTKPCFITTTKPLKTVKPSHQRPHTRLPSNSLRITIPILRWSSPPMWTTSTCTPTLLSTRSASKQGRNYTKAPKLCKSFEPTPTKFVSNMG